MGIKDIDQFVAHATRDELIEKIHRQRGSLKEMHTAHSTKGLIIQRLRAGLMHIEQVVKEEVDKLIYQSHAEVEEVDGEQHDPMSSALLSLLPDKDKERYAELLGLHQRAAEYEEVKRWASERRGECEHGGIVADCFCANCDPDLPMPKQEVDEQEVDGCGCAVPHHPKGEVVTSTMWLCDYRMGWATGYCQYDMGSGQGHDECIHCGLPEERK